MKADTTPILLDEADIDDFVSDFLDASRLGRELDVTMKRLERRFGRSPELEEAYKRAHQKLHVPAKDTHVGAYIRERQGKPWYEPKIDEDRFWPPLRSLIESELGGAVVDVDETSTAVINGLRPSTEEQHSKGLVLGYVQSGKTTNFLSVIAKAADAGFRLVIVLTGITENLRQQTQKRIDRQLLQPNASSWTKLTDAESDFEGDKNHHQLSNPSYRAIAVVKKNAHRLRRLNQWLDAAGDAADSCPILIIDDESDQASIDVSPEQKNERSAINRQINNLLDHRKTSYVAYSATPFANILIDPSKLDDLYPSDFIITLPEPRGYFGSRALFGREPLTGEDTDNVDLDGYDMIRIIPDHEVEDIRPAGRKDPDKTIVSGPALEASIQWFVMATAARQFRGQGHKHSSMLVHTSMLTADHEDLSFQVKNELRKIRKSLHDQTDVLPGWRSQWEDEAARVPSELFDLEPVTFDQIQPLLVKVVDSIDLIVENGKSLNRLSYDAGPTNVIAIGGNTLARGLTLEGLVSSYFVRRASAYDTLLQMGRWFGFRNGYQDLPRIWLTEELNTWFHDLSTVEAELREELDVYIQEQVSPMEIQTKIRLHPDMSITSKAKMQSAVQAKLSFAGKKEQTIRFRENDPEWLSNNIAAVRSLISDIKERGIPEQKGALGSPVFENVPVDSILAFLDQYEIDENTRLGRDGGKHLKEYIRQESAKSRIRKWNVSIMGQSEVKSGTIGLGMDALSPMINRSKLAISEPGAANIKALVTTIDRLNDVIRDSDDARKEFRAQVRDEIRKKDGHQESVVRRIHDNQVGTAIGHLAVYPISKDSVPQGQSNEENRSPRKNPVREPLEAVDHVMGLAIFFPDSNADESTIDYVSAPEPIEFRDDYQQADQEIKELNDEDERLSEESRN